MFGASAFGAPLFGSKPYVGALLVESSATLVGEAAAIGVGGALASSTSTMIGAGALNGALAAIRSSEATLVGSSVFTPSIVAVRAAGALLAGNGTFSPRGSGVFSSSATLTGEGKLFGYQLRAYNQNFPDLAVNNYNVQIGRRLYTWKANTGRWHPAGPAPT